MVPDGFASDQIAEPYGTFSYLPSLGRWVRIRYYTVPISYPIYNGPDGTYSYGSFNYDLSKNEWPGYGEYGPQGPYWIDGSPPPWNDLWLDPTADGEHVQRGMVIPREVLSEAREGEEAIRLLSIFRPTLSRERVGEFSSRSLALARAVHSPTREAESIARLLAIASTPSEAERSGSTVGRSLTDTRSLTEPERTASKGNGVPSELACTLLSSQHHQYKVTLAGLVNGVCVDCANLNVTHTMTRFGNCQWRSGVYTLCGNPAAVTGLAVLGAPTNQVQLVFGNGELYSAALGAWTGGTNITLTRITAFPSCNAWPPTVTVIPI